MGSCERERNYVWRHRLICSVRNIDFKGFRWLASRLPKWLIPNSAGQHPYLLRTIHGIRLMVDPGNDRGVELSLHENGTYEEGVIHFMKQHLVPGDIFIDVGANIGWLSCIAAQLIKENGKVLAFEAHPETIGLLNENIHLNSFQNIEVFSVALGNKNGQTELFDAPEQNRGGASAVFSSEKVHVVPTQKLDDIISVNVVPKIVKIDVEGFEPEVVEGAMQTLQKHLPILIIELTWRTAQHTERSRSLIELLVKNLGYHMFRLKGGKERRSTLVPCRLDEWLPKDDNLIFIHD
jgi:FkbM family methyltransferase